MIYLKTFKDHENMNEGLKNWMSKFLVLASLGLVPPSISLSQNKSKQREFVQNTPDDKVDAALFVEYLNSNKIRNANLESIFSKFKSTNVISSSFSEVNKYVSRNGNHYIFNNKYINNDYSSVDISSFTPNNYLTDMGNLVDDSREPDINNWISDYESATSVEVGVVTINKLPDNKVIEEYALEQFRRIGVGKKGANNGILIVLSKEDRKWNITTGYGIEGILPDITCGRIGRDSIVPYFKQGNYYQGIIAALQGIKSITGNESIEAKKQWLEEKRQADQKASDEAWENFWQVALESMLVILVFSLIGYSIYKKHKKIKEEKRLRANIDFITKKIEELKGRLPSHPEMIGSKDLNNRFELCKKYFREINIQKNYDKSSEDLIGSIYDSASNLFKNYQNRFYELEKFKGLVPGLTQIENSAYKQVEEAILISDKIKSHGYKSTVPDKSDVSNLSYLIPEITSLIGTDIDNAFAKYKKYTQGILDITSNLSKVKSNLSNIENSIKRIKSWDSEVNSLMSKFNWSDGSKSKLNGMIETFKENIAGKDWLSLCVELDAILSFMRSCIRKKEEEEAAERRRIQRIAARRSQESSGSGSRFGGGGSGGGGASGGW